MKTTALLLALALVSCTAFTAPKDAATGIRMDIPRDPVTGEELWAEFDPLNYPGNDYGPIDIDPHDTWQERNALFFGHF